MEKKKMKIQLFLYLQHIIILYYMYIIKIYFIRQLYKFNKSINIKMLIEKKFGVFINTHY